MAAGRAGPCYQRRKAQRRRRWLRQRQCLRLQSLCVWILLCYFGNAGAIQSYKLKAVQIWMATANTVTMHAVLEWQTAHGWQTARLANHKKGHIARSSGAVAAAARLISVVQMLLPSPLPCRRGVRAERCSLLLRWPPACDMCGGGVTSGQSCQCQVSPRVPVNLTSASAASPNASQLLAHRSQGLCSVVVETFKRCDSPCMLLTQLQPQQLQ